MNQKFSAVTDPTAPGIDSGLGPLRLVGAGVRHKISCTFLDSLTFPIHYTYLTQAGHAVLEADCGWACSPEADAHMESGMKDIF